MWQNISITVEKYLFNTKYQDEAINNPFLLLSRFTDKHENTIELSNLLFELWGKDCSFRQFIANEALQLYATTISHGLKFTGSVFNARKKQFDFLIANIHSITGFPISKDEIEAIICSNYSIELIGNTLKKFATSDGYFVEMAYENTRACVSDPNSLINKFTSQNIFQYSLLSQAISIVQKKQNSIFHTPKTDCDPLLSHYKLIGKDLAIDRYGLICIDGDISLHEDTPRLFDNVNRVTIDLKGINRETYEFLLLLKRMYTFSLSFRPNRYSFFSYINRSILLLEHIEFGKQFDFTSLSETDFATQLYDNNQDKLTVRYDGKNLYFEETFDDFETCDDFIFTQLFHFEILEGMTISHFDHEYILYSITEYADRISNIWVKGGTKIKVFKVDNADIPFDIKFVATLLFLNFRNGQLLKEYFKMA